MSPHTVAEETSLALHVAVAERLQADPTLVDRARARVEEWLAQGAVGRPYADAWLALLDQPLGKMVAALAERSERMHDLRQVSPFAGVLDPRTRWRIHGEVRARLNR